MIHAFALDPELVATWCEHQEFRFIHDKFGIGTPRVMLEVQKFSAWKKSVYEATQTRSPSEKDKKRLEELFKLFGEHKHRRQNALYDGNRSWIENAEDEYARRQYAAILATTNPRKHPAVLIPEELDARSSRWACKVGASSSRTPEALASVLSPMLTNCRQLHLVDPHFGPENARHRKVLEAIVSVLADENISLECIRVHCTAKSTLNAFSQATVEMSSRLPGSVSVEFVRWREKSNGDRLHNRYVLTDVGGVSLGIGLDAGRASETDDLHLLSHDQYLLRWSQYADENGAFECVDRPASVVGSRARRGGRGR